MNRLLVNHLSTGVGSALPSLVGADGWPAGPVVSTVAGLRVGPADGWSRRGVGPGFPAGGCQWRPRATRKLGRERGLQERAVCRRGPPSRRVTRSGLRWPGPARISSWERLLRAGRRGPAEEDVRVSKGVQGSPWRSRRRSGPSVRARVGQADWRASRPGGLASESARDDAADSGQVGRGERGLPPPVRQRMTRILSPGPVDHPLDRKGSGNHRAAANPLILRARARASVCVLF